MDFQPANKENQQLFRAWSFCRGFVFLRSIRMGISHSFQNRYSACLVEPDF